MLALKHYAMMAIALLMRRVDILLRHGATCHYDDKAAAIFFFLRLLRCATLLIDAMPQWLRRH